MNKNVYEREGEQMKITIDEAREELRDTFPSVYSKYITTRIAGDFAVELVKHLRVLDPAHGSQCNPHAKKMDDTIA